MSDPNPSPDVPDVPQLSTAEAPENGQPPATPPSPASVEGMSLTDINALTGRKYDSLEAAKAGVAETYRFVGQRPPAPPEGSYVPREEFELSEFFRDNPDHALNKNLIQDMAKARGIKPQDVVALPDYQSIAQDRKTAKEAADARSVLTSSPKLGIVSDKSAKAVEAFESSQKARAQGDTIAADRFQKEAESSALAAVISGFGMDKDVIEG